MARIVPPLALAAAVLVVACGDDTTSGSGGGGASATGSSSAATTGGGTTSGGTGGSGGEGAGGGNVTTGTGGSGGAGGANPADDRLRSGDRLRAIVIDGGGGARIFEGWYDSQLDVECGEVEAQGVVRCLPTGFQVRFLDDACTQPVVLERDCAPFPTHATRFVRSQVACNADDAQHYEAFRVTGDDEVPEALFDFALDGTTCVPSGGGVTVRRAEQVDVDVFVELTNAEEPIDDELSRLVQTGSDGSFRVLGAFDVERSERCYRMSPPPEDGSDRCAPGAKRRYLGFSYWGDDTCGEPAATINNCELDAEFAIVDYRLDDCNVEQGVLHERGAVLDGPLFETFGTDSDCYEQNPAVLGVGLGAVIETDTLPLLEATLVEGPDLSVEVPSRSGRALSAYGAFQDPSGAACSPRLTIDGTLRCVPDGLGDVGYFFADAACTIPLARAGAFDVGCGLATRAASYVDPQEECGEQELAEIVHLGPLHEGPVHYLSGDECLVETPGATLFATLTGEVDAIEELPLLEIVIE